MHRTLKQETASPPAATARAQQRAFDRFRREYNEERPHEALGMQTPAAVYVPRRVRIRAGRASRSTTARCGCGGCKKQGQFRWKSERVFLTTVLQGERVGLLASDDRYFVVYFAEFPIALFDSRERKILPLPQGKDFNIDEAGEEEESPSPAPHPLAKPEEQPMTKVSGMSPV